jgi:hypothetical protein
VGCRTQWRGAQPSLPIAAPAKLDPASTLWMKVLPRTDREVFTCKAPARKSALALNFLRYSSAIPSRNELVIHASMEVFSDDCSTTPV